MNLTDITDVFSTFTKATKWTPHRFHKGHQALDISKHYDKIYDTQGCIPIPKHLSTHDLINIAGTKNIVTIEEDLNEEHLPRDVLHRHLPKRPSKARQVPDHKRIPETNPNKQSNRRST